jgi:hypothetical protein
VPRHAHVQTFQPEVEVVGALRRLDGAESLRGYKTMAYQS